MFGYVQSFAFLVFADTQSDSLFYDRKSQQSQNKRPGTVGNDPEQLDPHMFELDPSELAFQITFFAGFDVAPVKL